ncbi:MAG: chromate transporter, partial [Proteobacteria bacterium]|nr:chromate transporter [Pseudomonadota bacterium]
MSANLLPRPLDTRAQVDFGDALAVWLKVGCMSFGGPAGQIAMMHRIIVDEKKWIDEPRYLHALNYCMLLPGPEAQQLATYVGWLMHGWRGGLAAGLLFIFPGALVMLGLCLLYVLARDIPVVAGALFGIKAAVLVIVVEAVIRIARRGLKTHLLLGLAAAAFLAIFVFALPFPLIVGAAGLVGYLVSRAAPHLIGLGAGESPRAPPRPGRWRLVTRTVALWLGVWWTPVLIAAIALGTQHVLVTLGVFFSKLAVVSFGGA